MKLNKIISSALTVVMMFMAIVGIIPATKAEATYSAASEETELTFEEIQGIVNAALSYDFENAEEMLNYELDLGYLVSVTDASGEYSIYVNRYTGVMYYRNNLTGQILTSNTHSFENQTPAVKEELFSQILIEYNKVTSTNPQNDVYNSCHWAAGYAQIATEFITGGIRVNYTLGDTTDRFLLPGIITAERFESAVIIPALEKFATLLEKYCGNDYDVEFSVFDNADYKSYKADCLYWGFSFDNGIQKYLADMKSTVIDDAQKKGIITRQQADEMNDIRSSIQSIMGKYNLINLGDTETYREGSKTYTDAIKKYYTPAEGVDPELEIFQELTPIYICLETQDAGKRNLSKHFVKLAPEYTFEEMQADEAYCGYVHTVEQRPVFNCSLEYTFNEDGSLAVRLPANAITFDETMYIVYSVTPLPYFGAGDMTTDGYAFFPDGSGTVIEFEDFYRKANIKEDKLVYGTDYAYSKITGRHHEQVTLPVYGIVDEVKANATTAAISGKDVVTNGFFAVIEEGESLAKLCLRSLNASHKFLYAYSSYTPYPSDVYDLSDQISVGGNESYTMTAETKYNGSYVTRITMLADADVSAALAAVTGGNHSYYPASYVGMATYYRDYLKSNGTLTALEATTNKLPLYIEALGSMEIIKKILSFPVTAKLELTTFDDIATMYDELSDARNKFLLKADEFDAMAEETADEALKASYKATADNYRALYEEVDDIVNINFRLTGFGNGGLNATYPTKVRWDSACGGKKALNELIAKAEDVSKNVGASLGIFPDYDFMYLNHTAPFDGFIQNGNVSKMIDNRYASKQTFNSVLGMHESFFTMVINPASLGKLYDKFISQYSKYDLPGVSVSTLGSDLNSNFDDDETVNRDEAMSYVENVFSKLASNEADYEIMTNVGNAYSLRYIDHIIDGATDSSHLRYSSYAIPFVGMVLHGYVNYTGSAINYAGNREYDVLRSIESGASLYYILCYQNSSFLKEDENLNKYYGIDYSTWFDNIVITYAELNDAIGDLQNYEIIDHEIIIGERVINQKEEAENIKLLKNEMLQELANEIQEKIDSAYVDIRANHPVGTLVKLNVSEDAILAQFADRLGIAAVNDLDADFVDDVRACIALFVNEYNPDESYTGATYDVSINSVDYESKYSFITESLATDKKNYVYTDFTSDIGNIVLVTYSNGTDTVKFILNYNIYSVDVNLGDGQVYENIPKYSYVRINEGGNS